MTCRCPVSSDSVSFVIVASLDSLSLIRLCGPIVGMYLSTSAIWGLLMAAAVAGWTGMPSVTLINNVSFLQQQNSHNCILQKLKLVY